MPWSGATVADTPKYEPRYRPGKALGETEHLRRLHLMGGRIGVAGRLNKGKRRLMNPKRNEEKYLDPD